MLQVISFLLKCDLKVVFRLVYLILNYSFSSGCVVFGGYLLDEGASKDKMYLLYVYVEDASFWDILVEPQKPAGVSCVI